MPDVQRPLDGTNRTVEIGLGYSLRAPGLKGIATARDPRQPGTRAAEAGVTEVLDAALRDANVSEARTVELAVSAAPMPPAAAPLRDSRGSDALELQTPDLGPDREQVVMAMNEAGAIQWILPERRAAGAIPTTRAGATRRFLIPREIVEPRPDGSTRGLLTGIRRKLLKVLIYPVTDPVVGAIGDLFAEEWEKRKRPYGVRWFGPQDYRSPEAPPLTPRDWEKLAEGRSLLFVHGTFSTAHGAFSALSETTMHTLWDRYEGRVFAFNHFTMSHAPDRNVGWLIRQMPEGLRLRDVDIVCHSRGGLVARTLAENPKAFGVETERIDVRRVVFVAVPNAGTLLADPKHMVQMIDRLTTVLNVLPTTFTTELLEAIITAVKVLGHGALQALDGLASMNPKGNFMEKLNATGEKGATDYFAITADYEPTDPALKWISKLRVADKVIDRVFDGAANDLVVPTLGVFDNNGSAYFPIGASTVMQFSKTQNIIHTTFFGDRVTQTAILNWLA